MPSWCRSVSSGTRITARARSGRRIRSPTCTSGPTTSSSRPGSGTCRSTVYPIPAPTRPTLSRTNNIIASAGFRTLSFDGVPDPRPKVADAGRPSADPLRRLWLTSKYPTQDSPIALATGVEAKLILAEAQGGATAVGIINALHTRVGLPATFASTDPAVIQAQIIDERRREFFADGHRSYDILRYTLPLVPPAGTVHPQGGTYGNERCLPIPDIERDNNPNLAVVR